MNSLYKITRDQGQEAVIGTYGRLSFLFVEFCTGFGKSKAALEAVFRRYQYEKRRTRGLIIVHNEPARDVTWPAEIEKFVPQLQVEHDVDIVCWASIANIKGRVYDWVIGDECHYITPNNCVFFQQNTIMSLILMTGVLPDDSFKVQKIKSLCQNNRIQIMLETAVQNEILNDYTITIWRNTLTFDEWAEYVKICRRVDHAKSTGNLAYIKAQIGFRMRFLYNVESKLLLAQKIADKIREAKRRFVIFTGSTEAANRLSPYRIYNNYPKDDWNRFLRMEIDEIASIKMIQEGANGRIESSLIHQMNSKQLNFMQKLGRNMRLEPGEIARIHITCSMNTFDESWTRNALKGIPPQKIAWKTLEE